MALAPQAMKKVMQEIQDIISSPPEGIKLIPNEDDITDLTALLKGPEQTPFEGGVFKIKLKLGPEFPAAPPKGTFVTKIFHPNVSAKGDICVNTLKKDWKPDMGIRHVLLTIKCLMITPNPESALNEEAGRLLIESYDEYCKHAKLMTSIHASKIKWEDTEKPASEASELPEDKPKENDPHIGNAQPATQVVSKPKPASVKAPAQIASKQKKSLKRL